MSRRRGQGIFRDVQRQNRGQWAKKLEHWKFHTNMQNNFFIARAIEHWNSLSREVVECPSLQRFKTYLHAFLWDLLSESCFSRGLDSLMSGGLFQLLWFCDFAKRQNALHSDFRSQATGLDFFKLLGSETGEWNVLCWCTLTSGS